MKPGGVYRSIGGGVFRSDNGGRTWSSIGNRPTAQFCRVALDEDFPYHLYGARQDNSTVRIASRTNGGGIAEQDWYDVGGGESGWIAPDPRNSEIVYAGSYDGLVTTNFQNRINSLSQIPICPALHWRWRRIPAGTPLGNYDWLCSSALR